MLLVFAESDSPRLRYILLVLLGELSDIAYTLTSDRSVFTAWDGPRLNYTTERITRDELFIPPAGLLSEAGIAAVDVLVHPGQDYPYFFATEGGDLPFDLFSASFYLVTRYEEYRPAALDAWGRFDHRQSLAAREGFLRRPLVNEWMRAFRAILREKFPSLACLEPAFRFVPTYDIDIAYAYLHRTGLRRVGGWVKDMVRGNRAQLAQRIRVFLGRETDPYDVYEWLDALHMRYGLRPVYFFLVAARHEGPDRNIDPRLPALRDLVRYHAAGYTTGLHPSWKSGDHPELLAAEQETMEDITGAPVTRSRNHYIRIRIPETYRLLEEAGIRDDYSMGYATANGFRASVAAPYTWYDLERERVTNLRVHPFCFMDANAIFEENLSPSRAFEQLKALHDRVKSCGGTMYTVFHNNFLGSYPAYKGWREVYEVFLEQVVYWDV
jgi:hypothetical protein